MKINFLSLVNTILILLFLSFAANAIVLNSPYPNEPKDSNTYYSAFSERPKHLDPARSYSAGEWDIIANIYEPPLQYHYLKRPYQLETLTAAKMPEVKVAPDLSHTIFRVTIKPGLKYQPHPAFVKNLQIPKRVNQLSDFSQTATRELTAADYVYQIKRLAHPKLNSPIFGFMSKYIFDLKELRSRIQREDIDLSNIEFKGATIIDKYTYEIKIIGQYPQFMYWLAMPFFAPFPAEADVFYNTPGFNENNITADWYPVGTGPYQLVENNPERRMVMQRNPNFHGEGYPAGGVFANQQLPFIDKVIFSLEKESIPYWNKFLQGYFDSSGISSDNFNSVIDTTPAGGLQLTKDMQAKQIKLTIAELPTTMYWAFNMLDDVVGGLDAKSQKLRQAIAIAFDVEEFITIFANGRGVAAQSPIPPGILGNNININTTVYDIEDGMPVRKNIAEAKRLLIQAGYPDGRDENTGEQLVINFEAISSGDPSEKAIFSWIKKQLAKLNISLVIRATDYNRFREKMSQGRGQMFFWGWNADYPDPENFLFMLYGPNSKARSGGENAANYQNKRYDKLFNQLGSSSKFAKTKLIKQMTQIIQQDTPWIFGYHPQAYSLNHTWLTKEAQNTMARNTLKYLKLEPQQRANLREKWNTPKFTPLIYLILCLIIITIPAILTVKYKQHSGAKRMIR